MADGLLGGVASCQTARQAAIVAFLSRADCTASMATTILLRAKTLDRQAVQQLADWLAVAVAVSLPWSTTATGILIALWLVAALPTLELGALRREIESPAGGLPILLWLLAALGLLWADVSWTE